MARFQLTGVNIQGEIELIYSSNGMLERFDFSNAILSNVQHEWLLRKLPGMLEDLKILVKKSPNMVLTEIDENITFDMFWQRYDDKVSSSKKKTLISWNKMSKTEQVRAYGHVGKYFNSLSPGTRKKYAETYLNAELWNN